MTDNYSIPDLIKWVMDHSVSVPEDRIDLVPQMVEWCEQNIGEQRPGHPLHEAQEGWIDYLEGDWAHEWQFLGGVSFWFWRKKDAVLFQLTWL
jgi:hypothetical protein